MIIQLEALSLRYIYMTTNGESVFLLEHFAAAFDGFFHLLPVFYDDLLQLDHARVLNGCWTQVVFDELSDAARQSMSLQALTYDLMVLINITVVFFRHYKV